MCTPLIFRLTVPDSLLGRFYANPLVDAESDAFVLHFYDLSARQPHTMYHFKWLPEAVHLVQTEGPERESSAMET